MSKKQFFFSMFFEFFTMKMTSDLKMLNITAKAYPITYKRKKTASLYLF